MYNVAFLFSLDMITDQKIAFNNQFTKKMMLSKDTNTITPSRRLSKREVKKLDEEAEKERSRRERKIQEMAMEVAADDDQPFPAPYRKKDWWGRLLDKSKKT